MDFIKNGWQQMPYCAGRVVEENLNSLSKTHPAIAVEWNCEKNGTITPDQVSALSKQEYWWKSSCGHEWKTKIYDRTVRKVPCPKCEQEFVYVTPQLHCHAVYRTKPFEKWSSTQMT